MKKTDWATSKILLNETDGKGQWLCVWWGEQGQEGGDPLYSVFHITFFVIVQSLSHVQLFVTSWAVGHQTPLSSKISQVCSNSCPLGQRCYLIISSSAAPFSFNLQSFPASGSFSESALRIRWLKYLSRDQTQAPCIGNWEVLATGPPGKSHNILNRWLNSICLNTCCNSKAHNLREKLSHH